MQTAGSDTTGSTGIDIEASREVLAQFDSNLTPPLDLATSTAASMNPTVSGLSPFPNASAAFSERMAVAVDSAKTYVGQRQVDATRWVNEVEKALERYEVADAEQAKNHDESGTSFTVGDAAATVGDAATTIGAAATASPAAGNGDGATSVQSSGAGDAGASESAAASASPAAWGEFTAAPGANDILEAIATIDQDLLSLLTLLLAYQPPNGETVALRWDLDSSRFDVASIMALLQADAAARDAGATSATQSSVRERPGGSGSQHVEDSSLPADTETIEYLADPADPHSAEYSYTEGADATQGTLTVSNDRAGSEPKAGGPTLEDITQAVENFVAKSGESLDLTVQSPDGQQTVIHSGETRADAPERASDTATSDTTTPSVGAEKELAV